MGTGVHDGHRERMKRRFIQAGLEGFNDHNLLEMLLFYAVPRKNTNELAHKLIEHFGSLTAVFEADFEELKTVEGVGDNVATLIKLAPQLGKRYLEEKSVPKNVISSISAAGEYFVAKFMFEVNEVAYALLLDSANGIIACKQISRGVVNATEVGVRMLVETAIKSNAASVIISHNHPAGPPLPSKEDEYCTELVRKALELVDIKLLDHIIVAGKEFQSLNKVGLM